MLLYRSAALQSISRFLLHAFLLIYFRFDQTTSRQGLKVIMFTASMARLSARVTSSRSVLEFGKRVRGS